MNLRDWWASLGPDAHLALEFLSRSHLAKEMGVRPPGKRILSERQAARVHRMMEALTAQRLEDERKAMEEQRQQMRNRGR